MKRGLLLKEMSMIARDAGFELRLLRDSGGHSVYVINGRRIPVPRHREVNERTAKAILNDARQAIRP